MLRRVMMSAPQAPSGNVDDFDVDSLSQYVKYQTGATSTTISSGDLTFVGGSGGNHCILLRSGVSFADGEVSCVLRHAHDAGLVLRATDVNNYILAAIFDSAAAAPNRVILYTRIGGAFTEIASSPIVFPRGTAKSFSFSMSGTQAVIKMGGTVTLTATVPAITAPGLCGMRGNSFTQIYERFAWP